MAGSDDQAPPAAGPPSPAPGWVGQTGESLRAIASGVERLVKDTTRRPQVIGAAVGFVLVVALFVAVPTMVRRSAPTQRPAPAAEAPAELQPSTPAAPVEGQPAPVNQPTPAAQGTSAGRQTLLAALPLLLGLFWLLSAWLVDAEARRAFVVQEPWGERRTVAYTALAVGCVFPLILAGLIFSAWGFVTFILDVTRRQSPAAGLQAAALILMAGASFLGLRGLVAQWLDKRRAERT
ncbi:MAG: hypothetical protein ACR2NO_04900 [Chloroflexota bacterium]